MSCLQELDTELAVVHAQTAHALAQQGKPADALERYTQILALDLQSDVVTHALCTSNSLALRAQADGSAPKVRLGAMRTPLQSIAALVDGCLQAVTWLVVQCLRAEREVLCRTQSRNCRPSSARMQAQ